MYRGLSKIELGRLGEKLAAEYLEKAGLQIICQNYRCPKGEIDLVAMDGKWLVFIEVRTRTSARLGYAEESLTAKKIKRLRSLGSYYLLENGFKEFPLLRFDFLAINFHGSEYKLNWLKGVLDQ
ncbi:MAG: YraN family protein [Peptococcaceae bacterium]|jgi:putative endonuclease|nr:YraN family protein [Peptococcaceae bacterium]